MPSKTRDVAIKLSLKDSEVTRRALMQLGADGQKALQRIEKRALPTSRGLRGVEAASTRLRGGLEGVADRTGAFGVGLSAVSPAGLAAAAAIGAVVISIQRLAQSTREALDFAAAIGDQASQARLSVESFQEYREALDRFSISEDAVVDGFKEMTLRADEFAVTGKGPAAEAFQRLGLGQKEVNDLLQDSDKLFEVLIGRIEDLNDEAATTRLVDELFGGTAGEQFVRAVDAGIAQIRKFRQEAREMGLVIDSALIKRADKARDELKTLSRVIEVNLNSALIDLGPILVGVSSRMAVLARRAGDIADSFRDVENKSKRGLQKELSGLEVEIEAVVVKLDELRAARAAAIESGGQDAAADSDVSGRFDGAIEKQEAELESLQVEFQKTLDLYSAMIVEASKANESLSGGGSGGGNAERINEVTKALQFQLEQQERTAFGQKVFIELQKAGIDGYHREARAITELVRAIHEKELADTAAEEAAKKKKEIDEEGERVTDSLRTATEKHADEVERLGELLEAGAIKQETYNRGVKKAGEDLKETGRATDAVVDGFGDLANAATRGAVTWQDAGRIIINVLGDIAKSLLDTNDTANSLGGLFGGGGGGFGGFLGGIFDGIFGGGGAAAVAGSSGTASVATSVGSVTPFLVEKGAAFNGAGGVARFAKGGVPDRTMLFPMRGNKFGVMNETPRDEGILPLARTASGDLGVQTVGAGGGGAPTVVMGDINVNVESKGGGGGGDPADQEALGRTVAIAVRETVDARLLEAARPGGILNPQGFGAGR